MYSLHGSWRTRQLWFTLTHYRTIHLSNCLSIYLSFYLSFYLSISFSRSIYLSIHPSIYLSLSMIDRYTQGHARDRDLRAARGNTRTRGNLGKPFQELQRGPKAKLPRPTYLILRDDCHLSAMARLTGGSARY